MGQNLIAAFGVSLTLTWHSSTFDITTQFCYTADMKWFTHLSLMHGVIVTLIILFVFCFAFSVLLEFL